jgi:putative NADH-flavin reductase
LVSTAEAGFQLTVFGATGRTGQQVIRAGLEAGLSITAYARHPEKLDDVAGRVRVIPGELSDEAALRRAVAGAGAVLSVLAPSEKSKSHVVSAGTERVLAAMHSEGVRRLVVTAGAGVRQPVDTPGPMDRVMGWLIRLMAADVYEDMRRTVAVVQASRLDWTVVRAPRLVDGPASGRVRVGMAGQGTGIRLSRADFGRFLIDLVTSDQFPHQSPVVSN